MEAQAFRPPKRAVGLAIQGARVCVCVLCECFIGVSQIFLFEWLHERNQHPVPSRSASCLCVRSHCLLGFRCLRRWRFFERAVHWTVCSRCIYLWVYRDLMIGWVSK